MISKVFRVDITDNELHNNPISCFPKNRANKHRKVNYISTTNQFV